MKIEIFNHPEYRIHRTFIFSKATLFNFIIILFTIVLPLLFLSSSNDFWITETTNYYKPSVKFKNQIYLQITFDNGFKLWSNIPKLKSKTSDSLNAVVSYKSLQSYTAGAVLGEPVDEGVDVDISFNTDGAKVYGVQLITALDYSINEDVKYTTEAIVSFNKMFVSHGESLNLFGRLHLKQRTPLPISLSVSNSETKFANAAPDIPSFMAEYAQRNYTVSVPENAKFYAWTPATATPATFKMQLKLRYESQFFRFGNSLPYAFKYAWLQYVPLLFVFYLICERMRFHIFNNQIFSTMVQYPKSLNN